MSSRYKAPFAAFAACALALSLSAASAQAELVPGPLVSTEWLKSNLDDASLVVVDIRGSEPGGPYAEAHVPGAVWSRYPGAWRGGDMPGSVPPVDALAGHIGALGIASDEAVVIVPAGTGSTEFGGAARVYWSFKYVGHDDVAILDGGWKAWSADPQNPVEAGAVTPAPATFVADPRPDILASTEEVAARLGTETVLVDSRAADFFSGTKKSAAAARAGHIPGSLHLDNADFYDAASDRIKAPEALMSRASATLADKDAEIIAYCNGGHWSATNWFVLHELLGYGNVALYVDSMPGWAADPERPVATAP